MSFLFGTAMLFAAFVLISLCRKIMNRPGVTRDQQAWGVAEAIAYVFTGLVAIGCASLTFAVIEGRLPAVLIEISVAMAILVGACIVVGLGLARLFPNTLAAEATADAPPTPPANRAGRTAVGSRPNKGWGSKRRAA